MYDVIWGSMGGCNPQNLPVATPLNEGIQVRLVRTQGPHYFILLENKNYWSRVIKGKSSQKKILKKVLVTEKILLSKSISLLYTTGRWWYIFDSSTA